MYMGCCGGGWHFRRQEYNHMGRAWEVNIFMNTISVVVLAVKYAYITPVESNVRRPDAGQRR